VTTVLFVRHGLTHLTGPVLAGHTPELHLDDRGWAQARAVADRLRELPLAALVSSPLERCTDTASAVAEGRDRAVELDDRFVEVRYGDWTGRELKTLAKEPLWKVVQQHPSAAVFPGGEGLAAVQARAVAGVRDWNARLAAEHGPDVTYAVFSHGDVIKSLIADALGQHLDLFQRISVDPCSVSVVRYTDTRPFVLRVNDTGGGVAGLLPPTPKRGRSRRAAAADAVVGGGAG
jgi:probable phosphomutase (TIGR03848 family)